MDCNGLYLSHYANGQMHVYMIATSIKLLTSVIFSPCIDSSQPGWFHIEAYMHVLGL